MRIGVLTFHASINYGSYWQARCLVEGLRARGHDAVLLDHRSCTVTSRELRNAFQPELPVRTPRRHHPALGRKVRAFAEAVATLPLSPPFPLDRPEQAGDHDAIVIGSDEVWNFAHPWHGGEPIFFGAGLRARRLISYAASIGAHHASHGLDPYWADRLRTFDAISVRDENTHTLVASALGNDPQLVLDPCLQFPDSLPAAAPTGDYALLYGHGLPDWFARSVRRWADRTGTRLISLGYPHALADEDASDAGPLDFAALVSGARAVATSFFHGTVFALHYAKPFIAAASPYRRFKLEGLTTQLGAERHLINDRADDQTIARLLEQPLQPSIHARIVEGRARSSRFLDQALG